jgi:hypothetical protein
MTKNIENFVRADRAPTDGEIAVERMSPNWTRAVPRPRTGGTSYISSEPGARFRAWRTAACTRWSWRSNDRPVGLVIRLNGDDGLSREAT